MQMFQVILSQILILEPTNVIVSKKVVILSKF